jgi:threonine/homoserine/homoserine lactone efflux protein
MSGMAHENWPWLALILLGAYHGLNPAMGWLFAVGLGLQEGRREAVLKAFWPIALGHAAAVTLVVAAVLTAQVVVPLDVLKYVGAGALMLFGLYKLIRRKHPRWVGMRVGFRDLSAW